MLSKEGCSIIDCYLSSLWELIQDGKKDAKPYFLGALDSLLVVHLIDLDYYNTWKEKIKYCPDNGIHHHSRDWCAYCGFCGFLNLKK